MQQEQRFCALRGPALRSERSIYQGLSGSTEIDTFSRVPGQLPPSLATDMLSTRVTRNGFGCWERYLASSCVSLTSFQHRHSNCRLVIWCNIGCHNSRGIIDHVGLSLDGKTFWDSETANIISCNPCIKYINPDNSS